MNRAMLCLALTAAFVVGSCAGESNPSTSGAGDRGDIEQPQPPAPDPFVDLQGQIDDLSNRLNDLEFTVQELNGNFEGLPRFNEYAATSVPDAIDDLSKRIANLGG